MKKSMAKKPVVVPGDSDDEPLWDFSDEDAFGRSSSSSAVGESSKKVAGTSSSSTAKRKFCDMDSDGSDSSECSDDLDCSVLSIKRAKKFAFSAWSNIAKTTKTIGEALDKLPMIDCEVWPSKISGNGLFACKTARIGDVMAVLSTPANQKEIANEEDAPAGCVQVHTCQNTSTYQTWQRITDRKSRYNGGCANAPEDGKNSKANCIIVKVSMSEAKSEDKKFATVLVAIRTILRNDEIYARYDNSHNNKDFFDAEKQASSSTKQVEVDTKAGFAGASKAVGVQSYSTRKKQVIKLEQPDKDDDILVAGWSDAVENYKKLYVIKYQEKLDGCLYSTMYRCILPICGLKRFKNGKANEKQFVSIPPSIDPIEVSFKWDMHKLIQVCQEEKIFFYPEAPREWFLAKKLTGNWKIVQLVGQSIVEVEKCWLNNLISLFGVGGPWEHKFAYFFERFLHECTEFGKHKREKKKRSISFDCLDFIPLCVRRCKFVEDQFHASGLNLDSILMFLGQDEVTLKMLNHASGKCICYGSSASKATFD